MLRLEISAAVQHIYMSLGFKRLILFHSQHLSNVTPVKDETVKHNPEDDLSETCRKYRNVLVVNTLNNKHCLQ